MGTHINVIEATKQIVPVPLTTVTFLDALGDDLTIVNAARTSFKKRSEWASRECSAQPYHMRAPGQFAQSERNECDQCGAAMRKVLHDRDAGLIRYLMEKHHGTPFEMVTLHFHVDAPIRVMREWQRHRIGSFNEMSTRYVEMEPRMFLPLDEDVRVQEGKPGHYVMRDAPELAPQVKAVMLDAYAQSWAHYEALLGLGVAKELAAYVLPLGLYSEQIWSVNLRSLFNFVALRNHDTALREIRKAAVIVEQQAHKVVPYAMLAFESAGRIVP